mgnify:FL=1
MEILKDTYSPMRGEFTLTEVKDGKETVLVHDNNMIMNRAKESLAEMLSGLKSGEVGGVYDIQPINRFELGSGSHTNLTANAPTADLNELRARTNQLGGAAVQDGNGNAFNNDNNQVFRIDFDPSGESDEAQGGAGNVGTPAVIDNLMEYDNSNLFGDNNTTTLDTNVNSNSDDVQLTLEYGTANDGSDYKNSITYEFTIPANKANQDTVIGARSVSLFDTEDPVYYSEAGLFVRKGDLDTTFSDHDAFAIKTFPPRPKATDSKWVVKWTIIF